MKASEIGGKNVGTRVHRVIQRFYARARKRPCHPCSSV